MLKKDKKERVEQAKIRVKGEKKEPVNRKLLVWLFVLTGLVSLFLWWRGGTLRGGLSVEEPRADLSFIFAREPTPVVVDTRKLDEFMDQLEEMVATGSGRYAVYVYHLKEANGYGINEMEEKPAASIMKIPVMITALRKIERGEISLADKYSIEDADRSPGSGPLQYKPTGTSYSLNELLMYLGKNSDNTAWVMLNRRWGKSAMQRTMDEIGLDNSNYDNLTTTAKDVAKMFGYVYETEELHKYLIDSIYEDRIPAGLLGTDAEIVAHKVGTDIDIWADAGIVKCSDLSAQCSAKPFVLIILNEEVKRDEATQIVPAITKLVWEFENDI